MAVATSRRGAKTKNAVRTLLRPRRSWVKWFEETIDQSWIAYVNRNCSERAPLDISLAPAGPAPASCLEREESAMRVVLLGASGFVGSAILKEALDRGHLVTAVFRNQGHFNPAQQLKIQITDVYDSVALAAVIVGHDALISAFNPGWKDPTLYADQVRGTTSILKAVSPPPSSGCYGLAVREASRSNPGFVSSTHGISLRRSNLARSPPSRLLINCGVNPHLTGLFCLPPRI